MAFVGAIFAARREWVGANVALLGLVWGALFVVLAGVALFWPLIIQDTRRHSRAAVAAAVLAGLLAGMTLLWQSPLWQYPWIIDVSTDLEDPPVFRVQSGSQSGGPVTIGFDRSIAPQIRTYYPDLKPVELPQAPDAALLAIGAIIRTQPGWDILGVDRSLLTIQGRIVSPLLRFKYLLVVRIRPSGSGSRVDMRSRSRDGGADLGANAGYIRQLMSRVAELKKSQLP
ncbi:MAG: DUF1499 domain-containing protein [Candidatus Riflebacteria bacterium]|nr:DUF1499 domain-containing protein [Candidatus Riflebacteria bacterium]